MIDSLLENLNYNSSSKKYKTLEEKVDGVFEGVIELMQYLLLGVSRIDETMEKTQAKVGELYQKFSAAEGRLGALEKYIAEINQKPAEAKPAMQETVKSQAIDLLHDLYNPNEANVQPGLAPPPPPPVLNANKPAANGKPSHNDLMIELKDKLKKFRKQQEDSE